MTRLHWRRCFDGWVSLDGAWKVRGPLGFQTYRTIAGRLAKRAQWWLYHHGTRYTPTGYFRDSVSFDSAAAAKQFVVELQNRKETS